IRGRDSRTRSTENKPSGLIHHQNINEMPASDCRQPKRVFSCAHRNVSRIPSLRLVAFHGLKPLPDQDGRFVAQTEIHTFASPMRWHAIERGQLLQSIDRNRSSLANIDINHRLPE
ncbi:MAG: hypothetical protein ACR2NZ_10530, partial [Rubripirellula sp.]